MKTQLLTLSFVLFPFLLSAGDPRDGHEPPQPFENESPCRNNTDSYGGSSCDDCEDEELEGSNNTVAPGICAASNSLEGSVSVSDDNPTSSTPCSPCTGGTTGSPQQGGRSTNMSNSGGRGGAKGAKGKQATGKPSSAVTRQNRSRFDSNSFSSFGDREYWGAFDNNLRFYRSNDNQIRVFDHTNKDAVIRSWFDPSRQAWANPKDQEFFALYLYKKTGEQIISNEERSEAASAILVHHNGNTEHYEVFWDTLETGYGRLTSLMDRNQNEIKISYEHAIPETPVTDRWLYMRRTKVEDSYGRKHIPSYERKNGREVITKMRFPNGSETTYEYGSLTNYSWAPALVKINHPDGTTTQHDSVISEIRGAVKTTFFNATAIGTARKTVHWHTDFGGFGLTKTTSGDSSGDGVVKLNIRTTPRQLREIRNGANEVMYSNRFLFGSSDVLVYNGGLKVNRVSMDGNGGATKVKHLINPTEWISGKFHKFATKESSNSNSGGNGTSGVTKKIATFDQRPRRKQKNDPYGRKIDYTRDPISGEIIAIAYPDGSNETFTRNQFTQVLLHTDRLGRQIAYTYDARGNLLTKTESPGTPEESRTSYSYNTRGQITQARESLYNANAPSLHNTQYLYNTAGYLIKIIHSADEKNGERPETNFTYDQAGRRSSVTDQQGRTTSYTYDPCNRVIKVTYNDTSYETFTYGKGADANLLIQQRNRNGIITKYEYDLAGRKTKTITAYGTPESVEISYSYLYGTTQIDQIIDKGTEKSIRHDYANRPIINKTQANAKQTLQHGKKWDQTDRLRMRQDPYGRKTYYLYDQNDRATRIVQENFPNALKDIPAIEKDAKQRFAAKTYTLTDKNGNTLSTSHTHEVTYTDPRDIFLKNLPRDLSANAAYSIRDIIYDAEGQILISTDPRGIKTWMEYDNLGRNTLTINAVGTPSEIRTEFIYDKNSNLIEVKHPRHFSENIPAIDRYTYNGRNQRKTHTTAPGSPLEATQSWTYYSDGRSDKHTDFRGNIAKTLWHACCGRLQASIQRDGSSTSINNTDFYGNTTHTAVVKNFDANTANYHNPVDADTLAETTTRFDGRNRPTHSTRWLTPLGEVNDHARISLGDPAGIPIAGLDNIPADNGLTTSYSYDDDLTDAAGLDASYILQLNELTTAYGYNPFGPNSNGSAMEVTNPAGEKSAQFQDGAGRTVMSINAEGHASFYFYDQMEDITAQSIPDTPITGTLLANKKQDANGNTSTTYTDGSKRTLASKDALGNFSTRGYDANSNTIVTRDPNGLGQVCTFDALNRDTSCTDRQEISDGVERTKTYNAASQVITSTNAEGHTTSNVYDERNRLKTITDPNNIVVTYTYDKNNNLIALTDGNNNTRRWYYDARNLKILKVNPGDNDTLAYSYDAQGRLKIKTDQLKDTCEMHYDLAGRMTSKEYKTAGTALESTDTFTYDAASRLTQSHKGRYDITTSHAYYADSMPQSEGLTIDGRNYSMSRLYDPANRPLSHTFADGKTKIWSYDARNLVTNLSYDGQQVLSQIHDAGYRLQTQTYGNTLQRHITYDRLDNLRTRDHVTKNNQVTNALKALDLSYTYNVDKQITAETTAGSFLKKTSFTATYDAGDRLKTWERQGKVTPKTRKTEAWDYDNAGNQTQVTRDGKAQTREHNADNELIKVGNKNTALDAKGNLLKDQKETTYFYDLDNRLYKIKTKKGKVTKLKYDALGRRVFRKSQQGKNKKTAFLWWGDQEIAEHQNKGGQQTIQNDLWAHPTALNQVIARSLKGKKNKIQYYHKNYLDHVYALSNKNGTLLEHYRYTAFGEPEIYTPTGQKRTKSAIGNTVLWNSRRYDADTGLYYYKYRHYKADYGRWPSRDPIGDVGGPTWFDAQNEAIKIRQELMLSGDLLPEYELLINQALFEPSELMQGPNLYAFVLNNPVNYRDLLGLALDPASRLAIQLAAAGKSAKEIAKVLCELGLANGKQAAKLTANAIAKQAKRVSEKELKKRVGDIHKFKDPLKKQFKKELGKNTNFDVLVDKAGNIVLKGNKTGKIVPTNIPLPK